MTSSPSSAALSVVVASFRDRRVLDACLASLLPQCSAADVPLIVARADTPIAIDALQRAYPAVRIVPMPVGSSIPHLRGAGLAVAVGDLVALTEDHCVADAAWVTTLREYAGRGIDVVGGGMDNARRTRAVDWAAFFSEYGFFAGESPRSELDGRPLLITGANVAYARRVLADVVTWTTDGAWENVVHDRLRKQGAVLVFDPAARIGQNLTYEFGAFVKDRYHHGHDYARVRLAESPGTNRWTRMVLSLLLPPLLTFRTARAAVGSPGRAVAFTRALPFTMAFLGGWAVGEAIGYLRGPSSAPRLIGDS